MSAVSEARRLLAECREPYAARLVELLEEIERHERAQAGTISAMRHEIGNLLSIAQANLEGIIDGVLEGTPERLDGIREALVAAGDALNQTGLDAS